MARRTVSDLRALLEKLISPPHSFSITRLPATLEFIGEWIAQSLTNLLPIGRFHCNHQMARDSKIARRQRGTRQSRRASVRSNECTIASKMFSTSPLAWFATSGTIAHN